MVLSFNESPYKELMQAQQSSWDSIEVEGVRTVYYYGGRKIDPNEKLPHYTMIHHGANKSTISLEFECTDEYYLMAGKFSKCLEDVFNPPDILKEFNDFDIIFRTNSSSYVNKQKLKEFAASLPKEKLYAGWTFEDSNDFGGACVSGAGIWLSRDTAEILRNEIDPAFEMEEDVYIGRILRKQGIVAIDDKSRVDVTGSTWYVLGETYHYRFKTRNRIEDADNMKLVHQKIMQ